jgi:hypothetical protein
VTVTNLQPNTNYRLMVIEYNGDRIQSVIIHQQRMEIQKTSAQCSIHLRFSYHS